MDGHLQMIDEIEWDALIPSIVFYLNNTVCQQTGKSPNAIVFGEEMRWPANAFVPRKLKAKKIGDDDYQSYLRILTKQLAIVRGAAKAEQVNYDQKQETL